MTPELAKTVSSGLDPAKITATIEVLCARIGARFPDSGLEGVGRRLLSIGCQAETSHAWIQQPIIPLRVANVVFTLSIAALLIGTAWSSNIALQGVQWTEVIQAFEAAVNELLFLAAGIFFLFSLESRIKRRRVLRVIHDLRSVAHIIDMHQLTKDPEVMLPHWKNSPCSPQRQMSPFALSRYLDYCSEMLSLTAKIASFYVQDLNDAPVLEAASDVESLTANLSNKIWQKIMILYSVPQFSSAEGSGN